MKIQITQEHSSQRLDQFLSTALPDLSRTQIQNLIKGQQILINGLPEKKNYRLQEEDEIEILKQELDVLHNLEPINEPISILYEDEDILVVDKPPYLPVHPDKNFSHKRTLVNLLIGNNVPLSQLGGEYRPGIVHRIDKDTSGLLVIAKTNKGYKHMRNQFEEHQITKTYYCLAIGEFDSKKGRIEAPIGRNPVDRKKMAIQNSKTAKKALSEFKVVKQFSWKTAKRVISLLEVKIPTGRTHQIRVHMAAIEHPLLGDDVYGNSKLNREAQKMGLKRQFLHAHKLKFVGPSGNVIKVESEVPEDLANFLTKLG
jgi:23S rRNA pseudouridine1911/1915/1917 synthase